MKRSHVCPRCESREIALHGYSLAVGRDKEYVCLGCGYHESYYTEPRAWLRYLEENGGGVQWLSEPLEGEGPYR